MALTIQEFGERIDSLLERARARSDDLLVDFFGLFKETFLDPAEEALPTTALPGAVGDDDETHETGGEA